MRLNMVGAFIRNSPFGTEIAFMKGLEKIGVSVNVIDTSYPNQRWDQGADATIMFKWMEGDDNWRELEKFKGIKVVFQPDDSRFSHIQEMMQKTRRYCDYALTFDEDGAKYAASIGYKKAQKMIVTADPDLYRRLDIPKAYDFSFVGSLTGGANHTSRRRMLQLLAGAGFSVHYASDIYDIPKIVEIYNRSWVVLNHATDVGQPFGQGYGYQCRHFEAGFTGACLLSNKEPELEIHNFYRFDDEKTLLDNAAILRDNRNLTSVMGDLLYDELNDRHRPEHRARQILDFIGSL